VACKLWDVSADANMDKATAWTDVSLTKMVNDPTVTDDVITTPVVFGLVAGNLYRCEIKFTCSGNVFEAYAVIRGQS